MDQGAGQQLIIDAAAVTDAAMAPVLAQLRADAQARGMQQDNYSDGSDNGSFSDNVRVDQILNIAGDNLAVAAIDNQPPGVDVNSRGLPVNPGDIRLDNDMIMDAQRPGVAVLANVPDQGEAAARQQVIQRERVNQAFVQLGVNRPNPDANLSNIYQGTVLGAQRAIANIGRRADHAQWNRYVEKKMTDRDNNYQGGQLWVQNELIGDSANPDFGVNYFETPTAPPIADRVSIDQSLRYPDLSHIQRVFNPPPIVMSSIPVLTKKTAPISAQLKTYMINAAINMEIKMCTHVRQDPKFLMYKLLLENLAVHRGYYELVCIFGALLIENTPLEISNQAYILSGNTTRFFKGFVVDEFPAGRVNSLRYLTTGAFIGRIGIEVQTTPFTTVYSESRIRPLDQYLAVMMVKAHNLGFKDNKWVIVNRSVPYETVCHYFKEEGIESLYNYMEERARRYEHLRTQTLTERGHENIPDDAISKEEKRLRKYRRILAYNVNNVILDEIQLHDVRDSFASCFDRAATGFSALQPLYGFSVINLIWKVVNDQRFVDFRANNPLEQNTQNILTQLYVHYNHSIDTDPDVRAVLVNSLYDMMIINIYMQQAMSQTPFADPNIVARAMMLRGTPVLCYHLQCYLLYFLMIACAQLDMFMGRRRAPTLEQLSWTKYKFLCRDIYITEGSMTKTIEISRIPGLATFFRDLTEKLSRLKTDEEENQERGEEQRPNIDLNVPIVVDQANRIDG